MGQLPSVNVRTMMHAFAGCLALAVLATDTHAQGAKAGTRDAGMPVASLPMYEVSDTLRQADDIFWNRLRDKLKAAGVDVPMSLARTDGDLVDQWEANQLLLSQACGFPYVKILMERGVKIVGTPVYAINHNLPPGEYQSVIIVRAASAYRTLADLKGKRAGVNDMGSNSGMNAFRATVAESFSPDELKRGIFSLVKVTGGHMASVRMVADGEIDVASIDSVSYDLIKREYPDVASKTRILTRTPASPGLPMITGAATDDATVDKLRSAIRELVARPVDPELRTALEQMTLTGFVVIDQDTYRRRITHLEDIARDKGYPVLR